MAFKSQESNEPRLVMNDLAHVNGFGEATQPQAAHQELLRVNHLKLAQASSQTSKLNVWNIP